MPEGSTSPAERLRQAVELHEFGVLMMRTRLRRQFPAATELELDEKLAAWLGTRPGAEHGDAEGTALTWEQWRARRT